MDTLGTPRRYLIQDVIRQMEPHYSFRTLFVFFLQKILTPSRAYIHVASTKRTIRLRWKRPDFIFFFTALFSLSVILSVFTSVRYVQIGNSSVYGHVLFFPLAFLCTTIINELYGYYRVRMILVATCSALMLMGVLMMLYLSLMQESLYSTGQNDFADLMAYIPMLLVSYALALLITDNLNALLFHCTKHIMNTDMLWFRGFIAMVLSHFIFSPILMVILVCFEMVDLPLNHMIDIVCSDQMIKMVYSITFVPVLYAVVAFVRRTEKTFLLRSHRHQPYVDPKFTRMRVTTLPQHPNAAHIHAKKAQLLTK